MEYIECKSDKEFESKETYDPLEFIEMLRERYPSEYESVFSESAEALGLELHLDNEFDLFDYVDADDFIDDVDCEITGEVICNYYLRDYCPTDLGLDEFIVVSGYAFIS